MQLRLLGPLGALMIAVTAGAAPAAAADDLDADRKHLIEDLASSASGAQGVVHTRPVHMDGHEGTFLWGSGACRGRRPGPEIMRELHRALRERWHVRLEGMDAANAQHPGARCLDRVTFFPTRDPRAC